MSSDESSELSSVPSDTENELQLTKQDGLLKFFTKSAPISTSQKDFPNSPTGQKRDPSPPHEYILADNPDIAFIVMFRSRFTDAFPKSLANFGPQELEQDVVQAVPGEGIENFLCALLGLLLNRKQDVKLGHYNRALEEAIQTHKSQWAKDWQNKTPLSKGATFLSMAPEQRLTLLRTLILWALSSSDVIKSIIQSSYKQQRQEDDLNQPLSVQPWGSDSFRRRFYLIEGLYDTQFRVYREGNHKGLESTWYSVAGNIEELKALAERLQTNDGGQKARLLSGKILAAIPRFEATEEKRKRKEYRTTRKQQFKRVDPDYSIYEGRTRGKRIKYTFSDEEISSDLHSNRRSARSNGNSSITEHIGPTVTQSGRQVKSRQGGAYGEIIASKVSALALNNDHDKGDNNLKSNYEQSVKDGAADVNGYSTNFGRDSHTKKDNFASRSASEEEDDSNVQDDNDEDDSCHESEFDAPEDVSDEYDDGIDDDPKKLIVKLPVQPPTPEKRKVIKSQLTPEKKFVGAVACLVPNIEEDKTGSEPRLTKHINRTLCSTELTTTFIKSDNIADSKSAQNHTTPHSPLTC